MPLCPQAAATPWNLRPWGTPTTLGFANDGWLQFLVVDGLLAVHAVLALRSAAPSNLVAATVLLVLGLHPTF